MLRKQRISAVLLLLLFLLGTTGVNLYALHCACEKINTASLYEQTQHCDDDETSEHACCKRPTNAEKPLGNLVLKSKGCCAVNYKYCKIKNDFRSSSPQIDAKIALGSVFLRPIFEFKTPFLANIAPTKNRQKSHRLDAAPPLLFYGRVLRINIHSLLFFDEN